MNPANPSPREEIPGGARETASSQSYTGGQKASAGTQTQESSMSGYAGDGGDYVRSGADSYRSNVLNDRTQTTQTNQTSTVHNDVNRVQMENQSTINMQTSNGQTIFTGNDVKMESHSTQTYEGTQDFAGGNDTVNVRSNNFASHDNVGYNNIHQSVDGEIGTDGRSYTRNDFGIDYGRSGTQHTTYTQTQTESQTVRTNMEMNTEFRASESKLETEMNGVATETQRIHNETQKEKNKKNSDDNK